jgi:hypothetical protein
MKLRIDWLACAALLLLGGCGSDGTAPTERVSGVITYNGQPVSNVSVTFTPSEGRPATGTTDSEGKFTLTTFSPDDGAVPGTHTVTLAAFSEESPPMPGTPEAANYTPPPLPFPPRYMDPQLSGLTAEVKKGEKNEFSFTLTD